MDSGPPIIYKKCSAAMRIIQGDMIISLATQKAILTGFYADYCAEPFSFPNPDDGGLTDITVMFMDAPNYKMAGDSLNMVVSLKLGILP